MMAVWDDDHEEMHKAFDNDPLRLADSLRDVAPPLTRKKRLRVWRGIIVDKGDPSEAVFGLSWTRDRDVARHKVRRSASLLMRLSCPPRVSQCRPRSWVKRTTVISGGLRLGVSHQ
jgi:hypothetical protein